MEWTATATAGSSCPGQEHSSGDLDYLAAILRRVGSPRVRLLFDIYHVQIMHGDIIRRLEQNKDALGHVHASRSERAQPRLRGWPRYVIEKDARNGTGKNKGQGLLAIVEDGGQCFAGVVEAEGLLDEAALAFECVAFELDLEGVAEDFDGVDVGVQGAGDAGDQVLVLGEALEGLFEDALAGAGNAEDQAESALLTMDLEGVVDLLLLGQQLQLAAVEGVLGQ